jgi:hypothetical protein
VLIGPLGFLEGFFQLAGAGGVFFKLHHDAIALLVGLLDLEIEALLFIGQHAGALAAGLKLSQRAFDASLGGRDDGLRAVRFGAGFAKLRFDFLATATSHAGALLLVSELDFLLRYAAGELLECFVRSDHVELLLRELLAGRLDFLAVLENAAFELGLALLVESDASLRGRQRVAVGIELLAKVGEFAFEITGGETGVGDGFLLRSHLALEVELLRLQRANRNLQFIALGGHLHEAPVTEMGVEDPHVAGQRLIASGLGDLALERIHAALLLGKHVGDAQQVGLGELQLAQRFLLLALVLRDTGGFFEDHAALFGLRGKDLVDLTLRHDRVGGAADAGVHEQVMDVLQTAERAIDAVLRLAVAENPAGQRDLIVIHLQGLLAVGHGQRHLGHPQRLAALGAVEDDIGHFTAAQRLGGGLSEHPADGVHHVRLAAAIRAHDAGDALVELDARLVREGLEAVDV